MPRTLTGFIFMMGRVHQTILLLLSIVLFTVGILPLEVQRRIVNGATEGSSFNSILVLAFAYVALVLTGRGCEACSQHLSWLDRRSSHSLAANGGY